MPIVNLKTIFPAQLHLKPELFNPAVGSCGDKLRTLMHNTKEELPRLKTFGFQNYKIGIIIIGNNIKQLDFNNTGLNILAKKHDCLAIWFEDNVSFPKGHYDDNNNIENLCDSYADIGNYHLLPKMIQLLIMGVEHTLLRRVVAIGQEVLKFDDERLIGIISNYRWIEVPKQRVLIMENQENVTKEK